jgi:hypothetical protein
MTGRGIRGRGTSGVPPRLAAGLAGLVVAVLLAARAVAAGPIDAMVAFDGRFIPALAATSAAAGDPRAADRARAATSRLVAEWPTLRAQLSAAGAGAPASARWPAVLAGLDRDIAHADGLVREGRFGDAHEALERVRPALLDARHAAGIDYFVDRLVEFHEPMEALVAQAPAARDGRLGDEGRAAMVRTYAQARALWLAIERAPLDAERHGMSAQRAEQYRRAVAEESAALARLSDALRSGDGPAIAAAAEAVKPPFARAYTAFGQPPGEAVHRP